MSAEYAVTRLPSFIRAAARFVRKHPDLTQRLDSVLAQIRKDPFAPSLRLHALSGALPRRSRQLSERGLPFAEGNDLYAAIADGYRIALILGDDGAGI